MAVFNGDAIELQALESALSQTGVDLELIVIDGGSTDDTPSILEEFGTPLAALMIEPGEDLYYAANRDPRSQPALLRSDRSGPRPYADPHDPQTSFNENESVVSQPEEALDCFFRTRMDRLVMGKYHIERV